MRMPYTPEFLSPSAFARTAERLVVAVKLRDDSTAGKHRVALQRSYRELYKHYQAAIVAKAKKEKK